MMNRLKWLLPVITLVLAMAILSGHGRQRERGRSSLASAVLEVVGPLENLLTSSARGVENVWRGYFNLVGLSRENDRQITIFESVGFSSLDISLAIAVYENAQTQGLGTEIPVFA